MKTVIEIDEVEIPVIITVGEYECVEPENNISEYVLLSVGPLIPVSDEVDMALHNAANSMPLKKEFLYQLKIEADEARIP